MCFDLVLAKVFSFLTFCFVILSPALNRPDITDTEMETIMDTIVDSLFCFFVTLGKSSRTIYTFCYIFFICTLE